MIVVDIERNRAAHEYFLSYKKSIIALCEAIGTDVSSLDESFNNMEKILEKAFITGFDKGYTRRKGKKSTK